MQTIKRIDVLSLGKLMGITYGCLGLLFMPFLLLAGGAAMLGFNNKADGTSGVGMVILAFLIPVMYGLMGFVGGIIAGFIYNVASNFVGGIQIELQPATPRAMTAAGGSSTMA